MSDIFLKAIISFDQFSCPVLADFKEFKQLLCGQPQVEAITEWLDNIAEIHVLQGFGLSIVSCYQLLIK